MLRVFNEFYRRRCRRRCQQQQQQQQHPHQHQHQRQQLNRCVHAGDLTREELGETLLALLSAVSALSLNPHAHQAMAKFRFQLADAVMAEAGP